MPRRVETFAIFALDETKEIIAGLSGYRLWGDVIFERLAVPAELRKQGIGKSLIVAAEEFSRRQGCVKAYVETGSYQAPGFYIRLGYREHSRMIDHPRGHDLIKFVKHLTL